MIRMTSLIAAQSQALTETLQSMRDVPGLQGSFVVSDLGRLLARDMPAVFGDEVLAGALLRIVERREVADALLAAEGPERVALAYWGQLVVNGALEDLLRFVDLVLGSVGEPG